MISKKIPQRMCTGCGQMFDKKLLLRIVCTPEQAVVIDRTGKKSGRGAYVCHNSECLRKAVKTKRLERNLKISIAPEIYEAMQKEMENYD